MNHSRCTGHCCRRFSLPIGPDWIRGRALTGRRRLQDGEVLADMVIPLGRDLWGDRDRWWYSCRHLTEAGDCAIYETRPEMCRGYPYDREVEGGGIVAGRCANHGCTAPHATRDPEALGVQHTDPGYYGRSRLISVAP